MKLSVVSTMYLSSSYINEFCDKVLESIPTDFGQFEIVLVDDGSPDDSLQVAIQRKKKLPELKIVQLSRNFGHHYAIQAGLSIASGDYVFLIDCDLEVSPNILSSFYKKINETGADVVFGIQKERKGSFLKKHFGKFFWHLFNSMSNLKIPMNVTTERIMTREYVNALLSLGDKNLFLGGMMYWVGFNQVPFLIQKNSRKNSTYNFWRRLNLFFEAFTSFSETPLKRIFQLGLIIDIICLIVVFTLAIKKILYPKTVLLGFTSIIVSIFFSLGVIISSMGLIGLYISRVFKQVQNRPNYIIKKIFDE